MRIKLIKGKQKELILLAKDKKSWKQLATKININNQYLSRDLLKEITLLSEKNYSLLCKIANKNYDKYIIQKMNDNWGRSLGGRKTKINKSNIKKINHPKKDNLLAEIIGIILGDGNICEYKKGNKIRCYCIRIAGNYKTDKEYIERYIPNLFYKVFKTKGKLHIAKGKNAEYFTIHGKEYIDFMKNLGLQSGNKKSNNQGIPTWIKNNRSFLKYCIRGLIDTDGSIHYISKNNKNIRISYTSYINNLMNDVRLGLIKLGFNPSKVITNRQIYLSSKKDVTKYVDEIGFRNSKNLNRLKLFQNQTPL